MFGFGKAEACAEQRRTVHGNVPMATEVVLLLKLGRNEVFLDIKDWTTCMSIAGRCILTIRFTRCRKFNSFVTKTGEYDESLSRKLKLKIKRQR
jgi:hypothetical protein